MSLEIYPASPADAPELTQLFYATFGGDFNRTMFPETADVTEWWEKAFSEWIERSLAGESDDVILKVTEGSEGVRLSRSRNGSVPRLQIAIATKNMWCGRRVVIRSYAIDLDMLGVHPSQQGRGLGSKLLKWGLVRADAEGVEVYLSASPEGKPLYEKNGFRGVDTFLPYPGYTQVAMIRSPKEQ
ncbi:hypothetical protein N7475_008615 [Penicillium sp. IBT 31633x]|nr:hypothetical protein N7475_008615 [Penicillium sp. IBT 31633x]